jgi:hypothetical protein
VYVVVVGDMFTVPHESVVWMLGSTAAVAVPYVPAAHAAHTAVPAAEVYVPGMQLKQVPALDAAKAEE